MVEALQNVVCEVATRLVVRQLDVEVLKAVMLKVGMWLDAILAPQMQQAFAVLEVGMPPVPVLEVEELFLVVGAGDEILEMGMLQMQLASAFVLEVLLVEVGRLHLLMDSTDFEVMRKSRAEGVMEWAILVQEVALLGDWVIAWGSLILLAIFGEVVLLKLPVAWIPESLA